MHVNFTYVCMYKKSLNLLFFHCSKAAVLPNNTKMVYSEGAWTVKDNMSQLLTMTTVCTYS